MIRTSCCRSAAAASSAARCSALGRALGETDRRAAHHLAGLRHQVQRSSRPARRRSSALIAGNFGEADVGPALGPAHRRLRAVRHHPRRQHASPRSSSAAAAAARRRRSDADDRRPLDAPPRRRRPPSRRRADVAGAAAGAADAPRRSRARTLDDWLSLVGAALGVARAGLAASTSSSSRSSGTLGFLVCWYVAFLGALRGGHRAVATRGRSSSTGSSSAVVHGGGRRRRRSRWSTTVVYTFVKGWPALHPPELLHPGHGRRRPDRAADPGRHPARDRRHAHRGRHRRSSIVAAARHRHRGLHDRGRRPARRRSCAPSSRR